MYKVTKKQVENILKKIPDPEIGVSLWDLGLIYDITIDSKGGITVLMTLTTVGCPLFQLIAEPIKREVGTIKGVKSVTVDLTFDPPWTTDMMSKEAKAQLGFL